MKKNLLHTLLCSFSLLLLSSTNSAQAKKIPDSPRVNEYFELLKNDKTDFEPTGAVCERVAVREVETLYPSANFDIVNSISYEEHKTTIGELDVVVFNKNNGSVEAVAEVKCWKSFSGALKKAKNQRMRFLSHLNSNIKIQDTDGIVYSKNQFSNIQKYFSISQSGGINQGFDFELSLNLSELMELRSRLLDCKAQGHCPQH